MICEGAVSVRFSEPVTPVGVTEAIRLTAGGSPIAATVGLSDGNRLATLRPSSPLQASTAHVVTVDGVRDVAGNELAVSGVPLERAWFDVYLNRVAPVPGKVQMDDWNELRELIGQPVIATGSKAGSGFAPAYVMAQHVEIQV